jgi:hypothetical protein
MGQGILPSAMRVFNDTKDLISGPLIVKCVTCYIVLSTIVVVLKLKRCGLPLAGRGHQRDQSQDAAGRGREDLIGDGASQGAVAEAGASCGGCAFAHWAAYYMLYPIANVTFVPLHFFHWLYNVLFWDVTLAYWKW